VIGPNGCDKTSLLRLVLGELEAESGLVNLGKNSRIAYFDQARAGLDDDKSVQENVAGDQTRLQVGDQVMDVRTWLSRFLFRPERIRIKVGALSGGERARVALAKLLLEPANLLLFDEPTNDLDVDTLGALEGLMIDTDATALIVSHDRHFLDRVCTHILAFEGEAKVVPHAGGYTDWRERVAEAKRQSAKRGAAKPATQTEAKKKPKTKSGLSWKEARELEALPEAIEALEARVTELEAELSDPTLYTERADEAPKRIAERDAKAAEIEASMTRWEELELKQEQAS
jgi:ATP-binding cassette subfamily F protein uup